MCGIIGYVGNRGVREVLVSGLEKLEYRGYDSAGISLRVNGSIESVRAVGNLGQLRDAVQTLPVVKPTNGKINLGIGHTRWATHGRVTVENAHPHVSEDGKVHVVVNGIVENYAALKQRFVDEGVKFTSETDAEVVAHLVHHHMGKGGDLMAAVKAAYADLEGHYAFVVMTAENPNLLVAARKECPLVVGRGEGEQFVASAIPAFLEYTNTVQYIENGEIVALTPDEVTFSDVAGKKVTRDQVTVNWDTQTAQKGGYETFMLKEIHEQPEAVAETLAERIRGDQVALDLDGITPEFLSSLRRIIVVACGTSYHAGLIGRYAIEQWARVPVEIDIASEFRYRNPVINDDDLVIGISQSGETADTLAAMRLAREHGAKVLAITNIMGSQATRDSDGVLFTRAGLEIGVAATKTFIAQVTAMYLFALQLAQVRKSIDPSTLTELTKALKNIPSQLHQLLEELEPVTKRIADKHWQAEFFLYLGRHVGLPVALEGALKLKEISYIATDAYAAGEMKHGPIALLDQNTPVVCIGTESPVRDKVISNINEVRARGAHVIAIITEGDTSVSDCSEETVYVPATNWMLQPMLAVIPLQLLAYQIAQLRGLNVDQPRNLAKTVTVE